MTKRKQNSLFITLDDLVSEDHPYRKLDALLSFDELANSFLDIYSAKGRKEKGVSFGLRTLVLQFIEDISDRVRKPVKVATDSILKVPPKPGQSCHFGGA